MSHKGEQEDIYLYQERKSLIAPSLHLGFVTEVSVLLFALKLHSQYPHTTELLHVGMGLLIISLGMYIGAFCSPFSAVTYPHPPSISPVYHLFIYANTDSELLYKGREIPWYSPNGGGKPRENPWCSQHIPES